MINYEQIKQMMGDFKTPIVTQSEEIPPVKNPKILYVSASNKKSLKELKARLEDEDYFNKVIIVRKIVKSGDILAKKKVIGHFDSSKVMCGDCSSVVKHEKFSEHIDIGLQMLTPNGAIVPTTLICPKCNTDYIPLTKSTKEKDRKPRYHFGGIHT